MPRFDGTGPAGRGPKTGGQMGNCEGAKPKGRPFDGRGEGQGQGRGGRGQNQGRGLGRRFFNRLSK